MVSNHDELMSNFFAQADALAIGKSPIELRCAEWIWRCLQPPPQLPCLLLASSMHASSDSLQHHFCVTPADVVHCAVHLKNPKGE